MRGDVELGRCLLGEAVDLWEKLDLPERSVFALMYLGVTRRWCGDAKGAAAAQDLAIDRARAAGDDWGLAWSLQWRAGTAADEGDEPSVAELLTESRARAEVAGDPSILGVILKGLCDAALRCGEIDRGLGLINEAVDILQGTGWATALAAVRTAAGRALSAEGRHDEALLHHQRALQAATEAGHPFATADALEGTAEALAATDELIRAVEVLGAAAAVRARMDASKQTIPRRQDLDALGAVIRRSVGNDAYDRAFERGRHISPTEVVASLQSP